MTRGWQSEPAGGWSDAFWSDCSGNLTRNRWMYCGVAQCSVFVVVVYVV